MLKRILKACVCLIIIVPETEHLFDYKGEFEIIEVEAANSTDFIPIVLPSTTSLHAAFPNPFNPTTTINYDLSKKEFVEIGIYNINGQLINKLINKFQEAGNYNLIWSASDQASGVYFLKLQTQDDVFYQKLILIK